MTHFTMTQPVAIPTTSRPRDVQIAAIGAGTQVLRSRTWDRLKFEVEYGRRRGTTANAYLIRSDKTAIIDPPGESFTTIFLEALGQQIDFNDLDYIITGHINSNRMVTLEQLRQLAPQAQVICSRQIGRAHV